MGTIKDSTTGNKLKSNTFFAYIGVEEALAIRSLFIYMNKKISQMHED
jgi:hypothetical protein